MKNIVILMIDALRVKNLSLFGYGKETDTTIKELAKENILFTQHFSTSNATAPALTSILTGLYPPSHGIIHQLPYTKPEEMEKVSKIGFWLPTFLKKKGYETICIDWVEFWLKKDFDFYGESDEETNLVKRDSPFISSKETIDLAISRIKKSKRPFFLFTHFWDTHFPFPNTSYNSNAVESDREKMLASIPSESQREYMRKRVMKSNLYTLEDMENKYDLAIKEIDSQIGRLRDFLKNENLWEDTIFIVLGDHGDNLTSHGIYFSHAGLYDDSIHVPMIMHLPGIKKCEITELTQHVDIIPTILDSLNFEKENCFEGFSLLPVINGKESFRKKIFAFDGLCNDISTVRTKSKKLIFARDNFCNLCKASHHDKIEEYDLEKDPEETKNVFVNEKISKEFIEDYIF